MVGESTTATPTTTNINKTDFQFATPTGRAGKKSGGGGANARRGLIRKRRPMYKLVFRGLVTYLVEVLVRHVLVPAQSVRVRHVSV